MPKVTQFVLTLGNKPGALANGCNSLADVGVNIGASCASEASGKGKVGLLVGDAGKAKAAPRGAKIRAGGNSQA